MKDFVCETENHLREEERLLEAIGSNICGLPRSGECWNYINAAIESVRGAIRTAYKMGGEE